MFTESIFLRRDWDKDKEIISRDLKYIRDYPDNYWVTVSKHFTDMDTTFFKYINVCI
jgi:hypothetical protein